MSSLSTKSYTVIAREKQDERAGQIKGYHPMDKPSEDVANEILGATSVQIVERIKQKVWTAVQVLDVYIERTKKAQEVTNCVTEVMFEEARQCARDLDKEFARTETTRGPLHGVPVSIKDCWAVKGFHSSIGISSFTQERMNEDAEIVKIIRAAGGIPFVKTNTCQTMMTFECNNPIWGRTLSPHHPDYTCGGSSGGEAALIAMDGSPLGLGSDIGGSLRIPAAYCGIYSFKPSPGRVSLRGHASTLHGYEHVQDSAGPLGRSVDDLVLACELLFGQGLPRDVTPISFREIGPLPPKLRFGYYLSDHYVKASPACQRAVRETVEKLTIAGHECIEIVVPQPVEAFEIYAGLLAADGFKTLFKAIGRDPMDRGLFLTTLSPRLPGWLRALIAFIGRHMLKDEIFARALGSTRSRSVQETWGLVERREEYKTMFDDEIWDKHELDAIIAPVQALPQAPHGTCTMASFLACGTFLYNLLCLPAGVIPITHIDPVKDQTNPEWSDYRQGTGHGSPLFESRLYGKDGLYNAEAAAGLPVGIQIIGKQWQDEEVLKMMRIVDAVLPQNRGFGPKSWRKPMPRR